MSETFTYYWTEKKVEYIVSYINQKVIAFRKVMNINVAFSCQTMVKNRLQPCCHAVLLSDNFTITHKYRKVLFVISKIPNTLTFQESNDKRVWLYYMDNFAIVKFESATKWHTGKWRLTASNPIGKDEALLHFLVKSEPDAPPEAPEVVGVKEEGIVDLSWRSNPHDEELYDDLEYQVEYNRETWDVWLKVLTIFYALLSISNFSFLFLSQKGKID